MITGMLLTGLAVIIIRYAESDWYRQFKATRWLRLIFLAAVYTQR